MYWETDEPSALPERLLRAQLLIALFSVRSDRQFCEPLDHILLFRWLLDMEFDEARFDAVTSPRTTRLASGAPAARRTPSLEAELRSCAGP